MFLSKNVYLEEVDYKRNISHYLCLQKQFSNSLCRKLEEERISGSQTTFVDQNGKITPVPQLRIHELRGETYNGLIRLLKPGCRTVVVLCDPKTKPKLMPKFHKACWPYRK